MDMGLGELWELVMDREVWRAVLHGVTKSWTQLSDWTDLNWLWFSPAPHSIFIFYFFFAVIYFFKFYFIFKLYIIVLVLPNIKMNPPPVYMCSPSWTVLPPPSPYHPSGLSQCILFLKTNSLNKCKGLSYCQWIEKGLQKYGEWENITSTFLIFTH